ncbi:MAG: hypothetical protein GY821_05585 [Gammaproteobacteria bacterium]|nr:hypothetical protein [Gammaproteobacteria bacterium]
MLGKDSTWGSPYNPFAAFYHFFAKDKLYNNTIRSDELAPPSLRHKASVDLVKGITTDTALVSVPLITKWIGSSGRFASKNTTKPDLIWRYPQKGHYTGPPNPKVAKTPGEHVWGRDHLPGSPYESWSNSIIPEVEEYFKLRGTKKMIIDLNKVDPKRIAADLRTVEGRAAAAAKETETHLKNILKTNKDNEVILLRE